MREFSEMFKPSSKVAADLSEIAELRSRGVSAPTRLKSGAMYTPRRNAARRDRLRAMEQDARIDEEAAKLRADRARMRPGRYSGRGR